MDYKLFEADLGGVDFTGLAPEIVLLDIVEEPAQMDTQTVPRALGDGMLRTVNRRKSLSVRIVYQIRTQDVARRAEVRDAVTAWAMKGGTLKVNTRPGKMLQVVMDAAPALGSSMAWENELSLTLTAYAVPYWQNAKLTSMRFETVLLDSGENYLADVFAPDGQKETPLNAMISINGETNLTNLSIKCGSSMLTFEGMDIEPGNVLLIGYSDDGIWEAMNFTQLEGDNSLLKYRTANSTDDLRAAPNVDNQIIISADAPLSGTLTARGRWL